MCPSTGMSLPELWSVRMTTRMLYLDDSGKPESQHASGAVVIGGFAIDGEVYPTLSRRVLGAKGRYYPKRGQPQTWEVKSSDYVRPNPWKRANNRRFCFEVARILGSVGATVFTATINKSRLKHPMGLKTSMPLMVQCLVEHLDVECRSSQRTGVVVSDWSAHHLDDHASQCVASFAAAKRLSVHPSVYYASSFANEGIQVADLDLRGSASLRRGRCQSRRALPDPARELRDRGRGDCEGPSLPESDHRDLDRVVRSSYSCSAASSVSRPWPNATEALAA